MATSTKLYCVVYRMGGSENATWHRTLAMSEQEAAQARINLILGGRHALYPIEYERSLAIGLPEGYDISAYLQTIEPAKAVR